VRLDHVAALVTGGASGLGRAAVEALHGGGAAVVIADLPSSPGEDLARGLGERATFCATDVTDEEQVAAAIRVASERFGGLRVAVNCAGIGRARSWVAGASCPWMPFAQSSRSTSSAPSTSPAWPPRRSPPSPPSMANGA